MVPSARAHSSTPGVAGARPAVLICAVKLSAEAVRAPPAAARPRLVTKYISSQRISLATFAANRMFSARRFNSQTRPIAYLILSAMALVTDNPELPTVGESHTSTMTLARTAKFRSHCWPAVVEVVGVSMSVMTPAVVAGTPTIDLRRGTVVLEPDVGGLATVPVGDRFREAPPRWRRRCGKYRL